MRKSWHSICTSHLTQPIHQEFLLASSCATHRESISSVLTRLTLKESWTPSLNDSCIGATRNLPCFLSSSKPWTTPTPTYYELRRNRPPSKMKRKKHQKERVYLNLPYDPDNPSSKVIHSLWRSHVSSPSGELPLNNMTNNVGVEIEVDQLTIAYHRKPNLGNLLSYRKIAKRAGSKVSSFC